MKILYELKKEDLNELGQKKPVQVEQAFYYFIINLIGRLY